jgi:hypothetical protein
MQDRADPGPSEPLRELARRTRRRIRQWQGTEPRTRIQIRCERVEHGGWWICPMTLRPGDVVYSIDRGSDLRLERTLLEEYGARTYIFDADPATAERADRAGLLEEFQLYAIQVGPENRAARPDRGADGARMIRLGDLMRMLGHRRLDLLKVDVDTGEAILRDLAAMKTDVRQLLVSFRNSGGKADRKRIEDLAAALDSRGYRIFRISADGTRYSFLRTDFESV